MRITSIGCALAGTSSSASVTIAGRPRRRLSLVLVGRRAATRSAACRAPAGARLPRTSTSWRGRGCRSRGSAGRCRCGRPCTARCCRRRVPVRATDFLALGDAGWIVHRSWSCPSSFVDCANSASSLCFVGVVVEEVVELRARLHGVDDVSSGCRRGARSRRNSARPCSWRDRRRSSTARCRRRQRAARRW